MDYGEKQLWWKSGNAEKPCFCLRFGAPYFYPDRRVTGAFTRKPTQKAARLISLLTRRRRIKRNDRSTAQTVRLPDGIFGRRMGIDIQEIFQRIHDKGYGIVRSQVNRK